MNCKNCGKELFVLIRFQDGRISWGHKGIIQNILCTNPKPEKDSNIPVIQKDITEPEENQKEAVQ